MKQAEEQAEKSLALLIPGLDGTGELYRSQTGCLAALYRVRAWSYGSEADCSLQDLTCRLGEATAGEPPGSILVIAESFGGLVGLNYALLYPDRVRRLILVNTFPYYRGRLRIRLARLLTPLLRFAPVRGVKNLVIEYTLRKEGIPAEARSHYHETIRQVPLEAYRGRLKIIGKTDLRARLGEIRVPVLLLASGRDKLVPSVREAHSMASRMPQARVHEFPEAGHALLMTSGVSLADYA